MGLYEKDIKEFEKIYKKAEAESKCREFAKKNKRILTLGIILTTFAVGFSIYKENQMDNMRITQIERNDYGQGKKSVTLTAQIGDFPEKDISVEIEEIKYTNEELEQYEAKLSESIFDMILGQNPNLDEITSDLELFTSLEDYPFSISWKSEKPLLINSNGELNYSNIKKEFETREIKAIPVALCASLNYEDYSKDLYTGVVLREKKSSSYGDMIEELEEQIVAEGNNSKNQQYQKLPEKINGIPVNYKKKKRGESIFVALIGLILSFGLVIGQKKEIDKKIKYRNIEIENDYTNILNQYALYYCAGMNSRVIWNKICDQYEDEVNKSGKTKYAYEEMLTARREINDGMGELVAYENFSKRCESSKYRNFIGLIEQSLVTGCEHLDILLEDELEKARRDEINRIRMLSQEMSTKLLFPMIMMLIIVIVIVIVPAFMSFG